MRDVPVNSTIVTHRCVKGHDKVQIYTQAAAAATGQASASMVSFPKSL
jgi:hypothetical protein